MSCSVSMGGYPGVRVPRSLRSLGGYHTMSIPDPRAGAPIRRFSETTGKELRPVQYVFHACRQCGELSACPMGQNGLMSKNLGRCSFCSGKR